MAEVYGAEGVTETFETISRVGWVVDKKSYELGASPKQDRLEQIMDHIVSGALIGAESRDTSALLSLVFEENADQTISRKACTIPLSLEQRLLPHLGRAVKATIETSNMSLCRLVDFQA